MAERFFAKAVKMDYVSSFMTELQDNNGVVKTTITTTPVSSDFVVMTYYGKLSVASVIYLYL